jgi:enoyl-CoA hydratase/carnithine racemase
MAYDGYASLRIRADRGVAFVTIDHPPINLMDSVMISDLDRVGCELEADPEVRVAVFQSADPEFFIAHADVNVVLALPPPPAQPSNQLSPFHRMVDRFRTMPKATIGKIEGRARGGGSELLLSLDIRFAAIGRAILSQPEVSVGIIPGGSGTQRLPRLIGRGRALEVILGCDDFSAELAERYGFVNRALPPEEIGGFVDRLAYRIASFPAEAIAFAKAAVAEAERPTVDGLIEEGHLLLQAAANPRTRELLKRFLERGGQTREVELALGERIGRMGPRV